MMPEYPADQFLDAVKKTILANKEYIPPHGKGELYIRPFIFGSGPVLGVAPAEQFLLTGQDRGALGAIRAAASSELVRGLAITGWDLV